MWSARYPEYTSDVKHAYCQKNLSISTKRGLIYDRNIMSTKVAVLNILRFMTELQTEQADFCFEM